MPVSMQFGIWLLCAAALLSSGSPESLQSAANPGAATTSQQSDSQATAATSNSAPPVQPSGEIGQLSSAVLKVTTKMVVVDAVVIDKNGKPVSGLKAEDFEVLEDGTKQEIRAFGASVPPAPGVAPPRHHVLPPGMFTNTVDFHPDEGPPLILLFDALNTAWADQVYGRMQLAEYLNKNMPRRNVAVYVLGHRLRLLQDFTGNPEAVRQAISGAPARSNSNSAHAEPKADAGSVAEIPSPAATGASANGNPAQAFAQLTQQLAAAQELIGTIERNNSIQTTLDAFRTIARHAAAFPGRKQLIWLSASFPLSFDVLANTPFFEQYRETADLLTDAQVAVYPVDVRGLVAFFPTELKAGMANLNATHFAMNYVASRTGGQALYNRNDVDRAIATAVDDGAMYYVLGYYPKNKNWNGEFRTTKVKVRQPGLKVRCRSGYFSTDPTRKNASQAQHGRSEFLAAVARDAGAAGMLPFFAQVIPPDKQHSQVFVDVRVDPHSVLFVTQPSGIQQAELQFITLALDARNRIVTSKFDTLNTNLTPTTFVEVMKTSLAIRQKLDLVPGNYRLRVGVRDVKTNLIGTLTAHVEVEK